MMTSFLEEYLKKYMIHMQKRFIKIYILMKKKKLKKRKERKKKS